MSCKNPLKAWQIGFNPSGKKKLKITSHSVDYLYMPFNSNIWHLGYGDWKKSGYKTVVTESIDIPCGKCIGCRLDYSRRWADRCMLESFMHGSNYFLTLTYDNEHLPKKDDEHLPDKYKLKDGDYIEDIDKETGEIIKLYESPRNPVLKYDVQCFMKRLRDYFHDQRIRYYACGEYGDKYNRPHYHIILFGLELPDDDKIYFMTSKKGDKYYISKAISSLWKYGNHILADCNWKTCAYTARYVMKKINGFDSGIYEHYKYPPEFVLMSRRPGLGYDYYEKYKDVIFETDEIFIPTDDGHRLIRPPRYFDRLLEREHPDYALARSELKQEHAKNMKMLKQELSEMDYYDILAMEEYIMEQNTKILERRLV